MAPKVYFPVNWGPASVLHLDSRLGVGLLFQERMVLTFSQI
jgi:hypothetical protein